MFPRDAKSDLFLAAVTSVEELGRVINEEREREIEGLLRVRRLLGRERRSRRPFRLLPSPRPGTRPAEAGG